MLHKFYHCWAVGHVAEYITLVGILLRVAPHTGRCVALVTVANFQHRAWQLRRRINKILGLDEAAVRLELALDPLVQHLYKTTARHVPDRGRGGLHASSDVFVAICILHKGDPE